jgi:hypothetical protein
MTTSANEEQKLRKALAGSTTTQTYHSRAVADLELENRGRHATKGATVTGSARVPLYPAASGPWNDPVQVPDEPPLGYSVQDEVEVVGTPKEVEESLLRLAASSACLRRMWRMRRLRKAISDPRLRFSPLAAAWGPIPKRRHWSWRRGLTHGGPR